MLLSEFVRGSTRALTGLYPEAEASGLVAMLVEEVTGFRRYTPIIEPRTKVPAAKEAFLREAVERLCAGEPIQYVLGYADFCGLRLRVAPGVLIPRPETEQLVSVASSLLPAPAAPAANAASALAADAAFAAPAANAASALAADAASAAPAANAASAAPADAASTVISTKAEGRVEKSPAARVLDLCTGSGCIAWALAVRHPGLKVTAVDLSPEALAIAASQRDLLAPRHPSAAPAVPPSPSADAAASASTASASSAAAASIVISTKAEGRAEKSPAAAPAVDFLCADLLAEPPASLPANGFDLITANPPYVPEADRALMRPNVLEHEPAMALFVPDADPLRFYRAIARWAQVLLAPGGHGVVEIHEAFGPATAALFAAAGFTGVRILPDFAGRDRLVVFSR